MKSTRRRAPPSPVSNPRRAADGPGEREPYWLYGLHAVRAALANPNRAASRLLVGENAQRRLGPVPDGLKVEVATVRELNGLLGDAVHQGVALWVLPLEPAPLEAVLGARCVLLLDHVTDPHNVGAILRSAAAFAVDAVVTTTRHSATEGGALAKAASGALDSVTRVEVVNLARAIGEMREAGFRVAALDSEAPEALGGLAPSSRYAVVLGAEGKGVRKGVAAACDHRARIEVPGALASLNVSNAAAIALYEMRRTLLAA